MPWTTALEGKANLRLFRTSSGLPPRFDRAKEERHRQLTREHPKSPASPARMEIVVFMVRRDTKCAECGKDLFGGSFLRMENDRPLCLDCADLGHLEYLRRGDTAVTRRATKYSTLRAVVVRWSNTRKRYERQGILAQPEAIRRAEQESLGDAELRERRRVRRACAARRRMSSTWRRLERG